MKHILLLVLSVISFGTFAQNWTWTPQTSPVNAQLNDVYFVDNMNGWAVGYDNVILNTNDGGQNWNLQSSAGTTQWLSVYFINADTGFVSGGVGEARLIKTTDGGETWIELSPSSKNIGYRDVVFTDALHGIVINRDSIFSTSDGGNTWTIENYDSNIVGGLGNQAIASFNDTISIVAGKGKKDHVNNPIEPIVYDRRWWTGAPQWLTTNNYWIDSDDELQCIEIASQGIAFTAGNLGKLYRTESEGPYFTGAWEVNLDLDPTGYQFIYSISFPTELLGMFNTYIEVEGETLALIYHTETQGESWSAPDTIPDLRLPSLHAPTDNNAWIVGLSGKIYHGAPTPDGIDEEGIANYVKAYPNPVTGNFSLEFNDTRNEEKYIEIMDITGRTVMTMLIQPANNNYQLNLNNLKAGIYFINFQGKRNMPLKIIKQ